VTERAASERKLHRKNERLDEFASVISHDIRNPLSVALGRIQLLEEETESEHVAPIARSLRRIGAIVSDTLTLARHGETVAETESISLTSLVDQCWGTVDVAAATLRVEDECTIHGDPDRLRHVLENLFNNSVSHGGPTVTVRVGRLGDTGFYVEDDGPGIPETERETVFEPGHRSSTGGTGFGLTIVRRIAEAHGWAVVVTESEAGGARFEFDGVDIAS
jgi:signal transduction histidine kinase